MITLTYVHDCPKDADLYLCPFEGEEVVVRPTVEDTAYFPVTPRCVQTTAELKLVNVQR